MTFIQAATIETIHKVTNNVARLQKFDMRLYERIDKPLKKAADRVMLQKHIIKNAVGR